MPGPAGPEWLTFEEFDTSEPVNDALPRNHFAQIANDYLATGRGKIGTVGAASSTLLDGRGLVKYGIEWMEGFFRNHQP